MLSGLLLSTALLLVPQHSGRQGTLGDELARHDVPALGVADFWHEITSYAVFDEGDWFGIAYYWYENSDRLPNVLRVRVYDRRTGKWAAAELDGPWGSILQMKRSDRWWYVTGHYNPSAASTLVLSGDLKMVAELKGAPALFLADGRVVYHNNLVHFAPAHPGSLSLYDPTSGRNARLFPPEDDKVTDGIMTDRSVGEVKLIGRNTVAFETSERQVAILREGGASDPETRFQVTCDLAALSCRSRPMPITR